MKGKNMVITVAKPHTIKKFELITRYVDEWARKLLGISKSKGRVIQVRRHGFISMILKKNE